MSLNNYKPGKIYESKQYDAFKLSNNRPVDRNRVEKLKKDIEDFEKEVKKLVGIRGYGGKIAIFPSFLLLFVYFIYQL